MIRKLNLNIGNSQSVFSIVEKERVQTMKIGIMGGTFEPIHIGHLLLGEIAYEDFGLDEIWFLPNGNPPHKETLDTEEAMHHRIEMVRLAIKSNPNFSLNLSEADTKKHSYTYQTMRHFNEIYPNDEFYFILGADSLFAFEEWKEHYKYLTELILVLNHKIWQYHDTCPEFAALYNSLWEKADLYAVENLKGEELDYFYEVTD